MTGNKEFSNSLEDKYLKLHIEFRDDGRCNTKGIGIFTFKRDSSSHLNLKNVMYVPGMKKKLNFVAILGNKGYDVVFSKGKYFLNHVATRQVKQIGFRVKKYLLS